MSKNIVQSLIIIFALVVFTGQSWAFGSRHHNGGRHGVQGGSGSDDFTGNGAPIGTSNSTSNSINSDGGDQDKHDPDHFPVAPVPEPMTLTLLGAGLAGLAIKKKMHRE